MEWEWKKERKERIAEIFIDLIELINFKLENHRVTNIKVKGKNKEKVTFIAIKINNYKKLK